MRPLARQPQDNPAIKTAPDTLPSAPRRSVLNLVSTAQDRVRNAATADRFAAKESAIILGKFEAGLNTVLLAARAKAHAKQLAVVETFETKLARIEREITDLASKRDGNAAIIEQRYSKWYMKPLFLGKWAEKGYNRVFWGRGQKVWNRLQRAYFKLDLPVERKVEGWLDSREKNQAKLLAVEQEIQGLESAIVQAGSTWQKNRAHRAAQKIRGSNRYSNLREHVSLDGAYAAINRGREIWSGITNDPQVRRPGFFFGGLVGTANESLLYATCNHLATKYASPSDMATILEMLGRNEAFKRSLRQEIHPTSAYALIHRLPAIVDTALAQLPPRPTSPDLTPVQAAPAGTLQTIVQDTNTPTNPPQNA